MKRKRTSFSKLLLLLESAIVLYTTYQGFGIAKLAIELGFMGTLPWIATMVTAAWGSLRHERRVLLCQGKGGKYGGRRDV